MELPLRQQEQGKEGENELKVEKIEEKESEDVAEKGTVEEQEISTYSVENEETEITAAGGILQSGTYKLTKDVTLTDANLTVPVGAEVTIDLNGHVLTGNGNGSVITVEGRLILNDSDSTAENKGTVDTAGIWHYKGTDGEDVTLSGGVITGGNANTGDAPNGCGGGVNVLSTGNFVMNGGNIAGCQVSLNGGAVYCYAGGKFTMNGGNLCYNTANSQGGAVMIGGSSEMVMTGGTISNNICPSGGGVIVNNLFTMTGGKIVNNTATFPEGSTKYKPISGGGLLVNGGNVTITGGEISGNKAVSKTVTVGETETEYKASGAGIRQNGTLTLSGNVVVKDNICDDTAKQNIFVQKGRVISLEGLGSAANIGFTLEEGSGIVTKGYTTGDEGKIHSDTNSSLISAEEDGELWYNAQDGKTDNDENAVAKVGNTYYSDFDWLISNMATKTAKIELLKDITLTKAISTPIASTLELTAEKPVRIRCEAMETTENGYILVNKGTALKLSGQITLDGQKNDTEKAANTRAIYVNDGAEFEIAGNAKITNFNIANNTDINIGGAIYAAKGAVTTISEHATMSGNRAKKGGAVYNDKGIVNINGGYIKENTAMNGGGIYNYGAEAVLNINGGEISQNEAADDRAGETDRSYGGGVVNAYGATATMNGGKIANNVVIPRQDVYGNARGGGVYNDATFTFNGGEIVRNSCKQDPNVTYTTNTLYCAGLYNSKELTINGGTIAGNYYEFNEGDGNKLSFDGVGVSNNGGTLTITNGTIENNYCKNGDVEGAGVAVSANSQNDATLIMTGGTICGNKSGTKSGAGLYLCGSSNKYGTHTVTADISGGKIVDNTGANGVSFDSWVTLNLSGNPVITGNKTTAGEEKDVYLPNNAALTLKDTLTAGATIKVTGEGSVVANGTDKYTVTDADAAYFAHNGDKLVQKDATENQLVLAEKEEGKTYSTVTLNLPNHVKANKGQSTVVENGSKYEVSFTAEKGYKISSVTVNGEKRNPENGKLTLDSISGNTTITVTEEKKAAPTLTLSSNSGIFRINRGPVTFTYTYNGDGAVTATSSDDSVATAEVKGNTITVTLKSVGTARITVSAAEGDNFLAKDATYDLTVQKKKSSSSSSDTAAPTYGVSTGKTENGKISVTPAKAEAGEKVTIKATPDSGYQLDKVTVKDKDNSNVKLTKVNDNEYTFTMPKGKVSVDATFVQKDAADDNQNSAAEKSKVIKLQIGSRIVNVDNEAVIYDAAPVIRNDRTLVPIRIVTETLGGKVDWNGVTKEVTLNIDGKEIKMTISKTLEKYGVAPVIIDGRTFVPVRFVADELGATVAWDDATKTVTITKIEK